MSNKFYDVLLEAFSFPEDEIKQELFLLGIGDHVHEIVLTEAEVRLFNEGFQQGIVKFTALGDEPTGNVIRSEILEWFITLPEKYVHLFRKSSLVIENVYIMRMQQFIKYKSKGCNTKDISNENIDVFAIPNKTVGFDLKFSRCNFFGGVDISNSSLRNTAFILCEFGSGEPKPYFFDPDSSVIPSIYACQTVVKGNLIIKGRNDDVFKSVNSDFKGDLIFWHSIIENSLDIHYIRTNRAIDFSFAEVKVLHTFKLYVLHSVLHLLYLRAKSLYIHESFFIAPKVEAAHDESVAIEFGGAAVDNLNVRNYCIVIGTINLRACDIKTRIDLSSSMFISPKKAGLSPFDDVSINLSSCSVGDLLLSDATVSIGCIQCKNLNARNIHLQHSKFINYDDGKFGKTFTMNGANIGNSLVFNYGVFETKDIGWRRNQEKSKYLKLDEIYEKYIGNLPIDKQSNDSSPIFTTLTNIFEKTGIIEKVKAIEYGLYSKIADNIFEMKGKKDFSEIKDAVNGYSLIIGEADFSSLYVNNKLDCAGGLFYGREHEPKRSSLQENHVALNLNFLKLDGDLFLNDGGKDVLIPHFKAYGRVDMHSARINQFYLSPKRGIDKDTEWRTTGLKYEYIVTGGEADKRLLEECDWFKDYIKEDNIRQPYEQLAAAYYKAGEDTKAKKVLITGRLRTADNFIEKILFRIIQGFAFIAMPAWRAFLILLLLFIGGGLFYQHSWDHHGFTKDEATPSQIFSPFRFSLENMLPIDFHDNDIFEPNSNTIPLSPATTSSFVSYHKILSTLFLAFFIIGITKIAKKNSD